MAQQVQSYYFDADILLFYFDSTPKKHDKRTASRNLISKVISTNSINNNINVKIPQVALGELMLAFCAEKCQPDEMMQLIIDNLNADFPNADFNAFTCANELREREGNIKPNDALIVAQALLDRTATWLFTTDRLLIGNLAIMDKMDEMDHQISISSTLNTV